MATKTLIHTGAVAFAAALMAGCGSSSPSASSTPASGRTTSPSPSSTPSAMSLAPASLATLQEIVLQPSDLPAGWKGSAYHADPSDAADSLAMTKCLGIRDTSKDKVAEAHSEDYALGDANISSSATSFKSPSDVDVDVASLRSPKMTTCLDQLMRKQLATSLPSGASIVSESFQVTPGSAGGAANVAATGQGTIKVAMSGQRVAVYVNVTFITGPQIEAELDTENVGSPLSPALVKSLVEVVAARAAKA